MLHSCRTAAPPMASPLLDGFLRRWLHTGPPRLAKVQPTNLKGRSSSSQKWLTRQLADPFVEMAKMENYRFDHVASQSCLVIWVMITNKPLTHACASNACDDSCVCVSRKRREVIDPRSNTRITHNNPPNNTLSQMQMRDMTTEPNSSIMLYKYQVHNLLSMKHPLLPLHTTRSHQPANPAEREPIVADARQSGQHR